MEKKMVRRRSEVVSFDYYARFSTALQKLKDLEQTVPENAEISYTDCYDGDKDFFFEWQSLETDEEFQKRISQESSAQEKLLEKERAEYARLKVKFEQ